jgi:hypothetical protein
MLKSLTALLITAVLLAGCGGAREESATPTTTVTVERTVTTPSTHTTASTDTTLKPYYARLFTADVPTAWNQEKDEEGTTARTTSQWRDPADSNTSVLIDTSEGEDYTPQQKAETVRAQTSTASSYREISFAPAQLGGRDGWEWEFEVSGDRRVDYFVSACNTAFAVLGSTSPGRFEGLQGMFRDVGSSVAPNCPDAGAPPVPVPLNGPPSAPPSSSVPQSFCETHRCIPNFPNGTGSVVQCNDGTYSHSGGRPGACSWHGGVSG